MIPLHVLTGFLGSGKTTVLAALLQQPSVERVAVLVNEVGELGLDHHLLERVDEDVLALPSGCLCCSMRGELLAAIVRVLAKRPTRIVVETSGIADPAPILHALGNDPVIAGSLRLAGVIAVVDAPRFEELLETQPEVRRQLEFADRILISKGDLSPLRLAAARERLAAVAPGCEIREAVAGRVDRQWLLSPRSYGGLGDSSQAAKWLHHGPRDDSVRTHSLELPEPAPVDLIQLWLHLVTQLDGHRLLRIKGIVECPTSGGLFVLQSAGHAVSPFRRLYERPAGVRGVRIVVIERDMPEAAMQRVITSLRDAIAATPAVIEAGRGQSDAAVR